MSHVNENHNPPAPPLWLPRPWPDYYNFYDSLNHPPGYGNEDNGGYHRMKIPASCKTAQDVYRLLPRGEAMEYGGCVTRKCIYWFEGLPTSVHPDTDKLCSWHSHPYAHRNAEILSPGDIYSLLKWRTLRAVMVGAEFIWVMEKTPASLPVIQKLCLWEESVTLALIVECIDKYGQEKGLDKFSANAIESAAGCHLPDIKKGPQTMIEWVAKHYKVAINRYSIK